MHLTLTQVDAFADRPFAGNPAAVCVLPAPGDPTWMQSVAREMNLSETAFLVRREGGDGFDLRWFTPTIEVDLCGHATLASAHVLWEESQADPAVPVRFFTRSGWLSATNQGEFIELDFPAQPVAATDAPEALSRSLGAAMVSVGKNGMDYLVEVATESEVRGLRPDFGILRKLPVRGVIVTARSDDPAIDFVSRFFAPAAGVDEDPVTGSAHCALGPFWGSRLGKTELVGYQASERGGVVRVRLEGDRVALGGRAVTVLRGQLYC